MPTSRWSVRLRVQVRKKGRLRLITTAHRGKEFRGQKLQRESSRPEIQSPKQMVLCKRGVQIRFLDNTTLVYYTHFKGLLLAYRLTLSYTHRVSQWNLLR